MNKEIGFKIKKLRENLKFSQEFVAKRTGYNNSSAIAQIEKGKRFFPISKIESIAKTLHVTPIQLMGWEKYINNSNINNNMGNVNSPHATLIISDTGDRKELTENAVMLLKNFSQMEFEDKLSLLNTSFEILKKYKKDMNK
ncbi:MAG: helix-turn-helix domain-containing protein [Elusimicrobiota bacterium]|jgi:transcriptional regulator with XRE-family HTH domain|nr:helix-turn-helix domain-containing protein [Elusimicrobiota bacterium]